MLLILCLVLVRLCGSVFVVNPRADLVQVLPVVQVLGVVGHVVPQPNETVWESFEDGVTLTSADEHSLQHGDCRKETNTKTFRQEGKSSFFWSRWVKSILRLNKISISHFSVQIYQLFLLYSWKMMSVFYETCKQPFFLKTRMDSYYHT